MFLSLSPPQAPSLCACSRLSRQRTTSQPTYPCPSYAHYHMFISPSSPTLSSTVSASGTVSGNIYSARPFPFPDLLPLSTRLTPPPNQTLTPSSYTYFPLGSRSPPPSELPPTMPPSGADGDRYYLGALDVVDSPGQSSPR